MKFKVRLRGQLDLRKSLKFAIDFRLERASLLREVSLCRLRNDKSVEKRNCFPYSVSRVWPNLDNRDINPSNCSGVGRHRKCKRGATLRRLRTLEDRALEVSCIFKRRVRLVADLLHQTPVGVVTPVRKYLTMSAECLESNC